MCIKHEDLQIYRNVCRKISSLCARKRLAKIMMGQIPLVFQLLESL